MRPFTVAVAALLALSAAAPARAADTAAAPAPRQGLFLTVSESGDTWVRGVLLRCEPRPVGRHPYAERACAEITAAAGNLDGLTRTARPCTKQHDPVTASASGTHRGRAVNWVKVFPNRCELEVATGSVFRF
ncbi:SSI family serine proteinase inhibitor [Streptomyces flavofungini]|uniref:SSI family serine proteinase inhibitor n=1 Tax=Streptomyces flavofungini TaxID=68200 RepID=UPI0034E0195A